MKIKTRNRLIIGLFVVGLVFYGAIEGLILPQREAAREQYRLEQRDPLTHDLDSILKFKSAYMGDASNLINLFCTLPLNHIAMSFQMDSEQFLVEVHYQDNAANIGDTQVRRAMLYDATAAFALIDNLQRIDFVFWTNPLPLHEMPFLASTTNLCPSFSKECLEREGAGASHQRRLCMGPGAGGTSRTEKGRKSG